VSEATGGKFANGAATGAFAAIVSIAAERGSSPTGSDATDLKLANGVGDPDFTGADGYILATDKQAQAAGLPGARFSHDNGLQGALFVNEASKYVLAYAGTSPSSWANWRANFRQAIGFESEHYTMGIEYARAAARAFGDNLRFTGHSLGGGIASAAAVVTGLRATTFNAAGLHSNTVGRYNRSLSNAPNLIRAYYSSLDVLSFGQAITPLPNAAGRRISLGPAGFHGMGGICSTIGGC